MVWSLILYSIVAIGHGLVISLYSVVAVGHGLVISFVKSI